MTEQTFREKLEARWAERKFVCVGLDPDMGKLPQHLTDAFGSNSNVMDHFLAHIVKATKGYVCAFKPNTAFFEALGPKGWTSLENLIRYIKVNAPDVPIILDAKRADIGNTNKGYVQMAFSRAAMAADAITVHPYLGKQALQPFLDLKDKGVIVLCRTSNPGAGEFQDLEVLVQTSAGRSVTMPLYQVVARQVAAQWNANGNCALVAGATYPDEIAEIRKIAPTLPLLIPGIGAQGGDLEKAVLAGADSRGCGIIVNSSSGIIYASNGSDFAEAAGRAARELNDGIVAVLAKKEVTA